VEHDDVAGRKPAAPQHPLLQIHVPSKHLSPTKKRTHLIYITYAHGETLHLSEHAMVEGHTTIHQGLQQIHANVQPGTMQNAASRKKA
jgi:hypothetical protein